MTESSAHKTMRAEEYSKRVARLIVRKAVVKTITTTNTTPAKPREGRFGYIWFVCDLQFQGWCSKSEPKSNTQVILLTILTGWKMAASSVLTVN